MRGALAACLVGLLLLGTAAVLKAVDGEGSGLFACAAGSCFGLFFLLLSLAFLRSGKAFSPFRSRSSEGLVDRAYCPLPYWTYVGIYAVTGLLLLFATLRAFLRG